MGELVLPEKTITQGIYDYGRKLGRFMEHNPVLKQFVAQPDYAMVKAATPRDFNDKFSELQWLACERPFFREIDWRFLVAARLLTPVALGQDQIVQRVAVMEAKSPDGTVDHLGGVEYVSFFVDNFGQAATVLRNRNIRCEVRMDGVQRWLEIPLDNNRQEIRFSGTVIEERIDHSLELETGRRL